MTGANAVQQDLIISEGGDLLDFGSKVVGVISQQKELVDFF